MTGPSTSTTADGDAPQTPVRGLLELSLLLLGAEVCRHLAWPVRSAGLVFSVATVAAAIHLLVQVQRHRPRSQWPALAGTTGVVAGAAMAFSHVLLLLSGLFLGDYEQCFEQALTRQAQQTCQQDLESLVPELLGTAAR